MAFVESILHITGATITLLFFSFCVESSSMAASSLRTARPICPILPAGRSEHRVGLHHLRRAHAGVGSLEASLFGGQCRFLHHRRDMEFLLE